MGTKKRFPPARSIKSGLLQKYLTHAKLLLNSSKLKLNKCHYSRLREAHRYRRSSMKLEAALQIAGWDPQPFKIADPIAGQWRNPRVEYRSTKLKLYTDSRLGPTTIQNWRSQKRSTNPRGQGSAEEQNQWSRTRRHLNTRKKKHRSLAPFSETLLNKDMMFITFTFNNNILKPTPILHRK